MLRRIFDGDRSDSLLVIAGPYNVATACELLTRLASREEKAREQAPQSGDEGHSSITLGNKPPQIPALVPVVTSANGQHVGPSDRPAGREVQAQSGP
jgi:hypothetical protein